MESPRKMNDKYGFTRFKTNALALRAMKFCAQSRTHTARPGLLKSPHSFVYRYVNSSVTLVEGTTAARTMVPGPPRRGLVV